MGDAWRGHAATLSIVRWRIVTALLDDAEELVEIHFLICRGVVRISSSLAAILHGGSRICTTVDVGCVLLASGCQTAAYGPERFAGLARGESHVSVLPLVAQCTTLGLLVQIRSVRPRLQARLLHHEVADRVQVAMTARQGAHVSAALVARRGDAVRDFAFSILLLLLRIEQVLLELLRIERIGNFLSNLVGSRRLTVILHIVGRVIGVRGAVVLAGGHSRRLPLVVRLRSWHRVSRLLVLALGARLTNVSNVGVSFIAVISLTLLGLFRSILLLVLGQQIFTFLVLVIEPLGVTGVAGADYYALVDLVGLGARRAAGLLRLGFLTRALERDIFFRHSLRHDTLVDLLMLLLNFVVELRGLVRLLRLRLYVVIRAALELRLRLLGEDLAGFWLFAVARGLAVTLVEHHRVALCLVLTAAEEVVLLYRRSSRLGLFPF